MLLKKTKDATDRLIDNEQIKQWIGRTTIMLARFALLLGLLLSALWIASLINAPNIIEHLLGLAVFIVLFVMVVMLSIDNFVYRYLKASVWGQIVLYSLVALVSSQSYLWAAGEVNRIFKVDPSVLGLTLTSMTALRFFEYTVAALLGSYGIAICFYFLSQPLVRFIKPSGFQQDGFGERGPKLLFSLLLLAFS